MRASDTYRAARRNAARRLDRGIAHWRQSHFHARRANAIAKLPDRQKQCAEANSLALQAAFAENVLQTGGLPRAIVVDNALREFWRKQKPSRVVSRILRQLGPAPKAA